MAQNLLTLDAVTRTHAARPDPVDVQHLLQRPGRRWSVMADRRWYATARPTPPWRTTSDGDEIALVARAEAGGRPRVCMAPSPGGGAPLRMTLPRPGPSHRQTRRAPGYSSVGPTTWATQASSP